MLRRTLFSTQCQTFTCNRLSLRKNYRKLFPAASCITWVPPFTTLPPCRHYTQRLQKFNHEMFDLMKKFNSDSSESKVILEKMWQVIDQLKQTGEPFNRKTYEFILDAYALEKDSSHIFELCDQMKLQGLIPRLKFFHKALEMSIEENDPVLQAKILHYLDSSNHKRTAQTYHYMFVCMRETFELERALDTLDIMKKEGIKPKFLSYLSVVEMAIQIQHSSLAFELLENMESLDLFKNEDRSIYVDALRSAAYNSGYDIIKTYWKKVVVDYKLELDEGLCLYILNLAGENSNPLLATEVVQYLGEKGFRYRECHFMPLIEAFVSTNNFENTFKIFNAMREAGIQPNKRIATPIVYKLGRDKNAIAKAQDALVNIAKKSEKVDIVAFNLVIHALAYNGENQAAVEFYGHADDLNVTPNSETLDALLDACIHAKDAKLGKSIYRELVSSRGISETATNLSKMVTLMCTQIDYEGAFTYLERMKKLKMVPLQGCYYKLVKTLANAHDPRLTLAIKDMKAYGYPISTYLNAFIEAQQDADETHCELGHVMLR